LILGREQSISNDQFPHTYQFINHSLHGTCLQRTESRVLVWVDVFILKIVFYGGSVLYAVFPFKSATVVAFAAASPVLLTGAKILLAAPFFYHGFNGLRHLVSANN
jgi:succinate dehydrogenase/fumarate reductase cytochrome b subunit